jgi:hypothetical protein
MPIIQRLLFVPGDDGGYKRIASRAESNLRLILGSIVALATPLSAESLAGLLAMDLDDVNTWLRKLHAVLNVPRDPKAPIEILHQSFSDFLLGQEGTGMEGFRVHLVETHVLLAMKCLDRMKRMDGLRKDMCRLEDYGKLKDEIDLDAITKAIPPDLAYACLNWMFHLQKCRRYTTNQGKINHITLTKTSITFSDDNFFIGLRR